MDAGIRAFGSVRSLTVDTIADNLVFTGGLLGQWGFSALLEISYQDGGRRKILFDTGGIKDGFLYNLKKMHLDLSDIDGLVISHGHGDHTAATVEALQMARRKVPVIVHPHTFKRRFRIEKSGKRRFSGVPKKERARDIERAGGEIVYTTVPHEVVPGVSTTGEIPRKTSFEKVDRARRIVLQGKAVRDRILDDQSLSINVRRQGAYIITGCAHSGIVNILNHVERSLEPERICAVIGGLHLVGKREHEIARVLDHLREFDLDFIAPCHCTGFRAMAMMHAMDDPQFILNFAGRRIESRKYKKNPVL